MFKKPFSLVEFEITLNKILASLHYFYANFISKEHFSNRNNLYSLQGRIQDFKLGGALKKKLRRAEGGANIFEVFRVKKKVDRE